MELIGVYLDYRKYLKDQLGLKALANPQYSLRAFARDLEISPQVLSSVLSGKKNISSEVALELAQRLKLSDEERSYFYDLVELSQAKTQNLREIIQYRLSRYEENKSYRTIQEDVFKIIADWHHAAILELTETDDFKNDPQWISTRLGITPQ
ncbi:MAG: TIGR02147 family protein, partial [Proteobacteria bacterium]